jgi:hypothetical protein
MFQYIAQNFQMGRVIEKANINAWSDEDALRQAHAKLRIKGASAPNGSKVQVIGIKRV